MNTATILVTLVGTVWMFSALPMLVCASWHHRSEKFNTGRGRGQRFVAMWFLHRVSQLNLTRIADIAARGFFVAGDSWLNSQAHGDSAGIKPAPIF